MAKCFRVPCLCAFILGVGLFFVSLDRRAESGSFIFAGEANGKDRIAHVENYTGAGNNQVIALTIGIDNTSPNAAAMEISVQNIRTVVNGMTPVSPNLFLNAANSIPSGMVDFESVAIHEVIHSLGIAHPNAATESGLSSVDYNYTRATDGVEDNVSFNPPDLDLNPGFDGIKGSSDDIRSDDVNMHWFRISNNNPFTIATTVDSSTYTRTGALPAGHTFAANADRSVGAALGVPNSEAVMQQGSFSDEDQRQMSFDDVATLRLAMSGLDETAGTSDDYTFSLTYIGQVAPGGADITLKFDDSETGFAVSKSSGSFLGSHVVITETNVFFNTGSNWFFNPTLLGSMPTPTPTPTPTPGPSTSNDDCDNAFAVTNGRVFGTNIGATAGPLDAFPDVWYSYTPTVSGSVTISTCEPGTDFDTKLEVYTSCPAVPTAPLAVNDDAGGACMLTSVIPDLAVTANTTYLIRVRGFNGLTGAFELSIDGPSGAIDFTTGMGNANNWIGGTFPGFGGTTELKAGGLCMDVPAAGSNAVGWFSPERFIDLVDDVIYEVCVTTGTNQSMTDEIPLWFFQFDNPGANTYGGEYWVLDVDGGANGIDRMRSTFKFYFAPNAVGTPQWKSTTSGAFTAAADAENDMRLAAKILDSNANLLAANDSGEICIEKIEIKSLPRTGLLAFPSYTALTIAANTHFVELPGEEPGGTATISGGDVRYALNTSGTISKTLGPFDMSLGSSFNEQLYPANWVADTIYRVRVRVRAESSETDPLDAIIIQADTTNVELGMSNFTTRGATGGNLDRAASPRTVAADYEAFFHGQAGTSSATPFAARLRPLISFFNTDELFGAGTGSDPFIVEQLRVDRVIFQ